MEIDQVVVNIELWNRVLKGDDEARKELATKLTGIELYMHAMQWDRNTEMVVTLRDLEGANVVDYVRIGAPFKPGIITFYNSDGERRDVHVRDDGSRLE